jgi:hypothetical protein
VKARRAASRPQIQITSEFQLDTTGLDYLILAVWDVDQVAGEYGNGYTLTQYTDRIETLAANDVTASEMFASRLAAIGFRWEDDYSDVYWTHGQSRLFQVSDKFPRLTENAIPDGISNVTYSLHLDHLTQFEISAKRLEEVLNGHQS